MGDAEFPAQGVELPSFGWITTILDFVLSPVSLSIITVISTLFVLWKLITFVDDTLPGGE